MELSPEAKFTLDLQSVLTKIRKEYLYKTDFDKPLVYKVDKLNIIAGDVSAEDECALIEKLKSWKVLGLQDSSEPNISDQKTFYMELNLSRLNQLTRLIENGLAKELDPKHLLILIREFGNPVSEDPNINFEIWELSREPKKTKSKRTLNLSDRKITNIRVIYDLSPENRENIKRFIEIIQNQIELQGFNRLTRVIKVPLSLLEREGYSIQETKIFANKLNLVTNLSFLEILNDEVSNERYDSMRVLAARKYIFGWGEALKKFTEKDAKEYLILGLESPSALQDIKEHIAHFERKLSENNDLREMKSLVSLENQKLIFTDSDARIQVNDRICQFPPFKNEHFFVRVFFKEGIKVNEFIDWSIIYERMTSTQPKDEKANERTVHDTMYLVNDRIRKEVGTNNDLFSWKNKSIKRNF